MASVRSLINRYITYYLRKLEKCTFAPPHVYKRAKHRLLQSI